MVDSHRTETAPVALWAAMASLTGGFEPVASLVEGRSEGGKTEWRSLWLTEAVIAYGAVAKAHEGWTAYSQRSDDNQPDGTAGWVRSLRSIAKVELGSALCWHEESRGVGGENWMWSSTARIVLTDDEPIVLPLFGEVMSDQMDEDVQAFINALLTRM